MSLRTMLNVSVNVASPVNATDSTGGFSTTFPDKVPYPAAVQIDSTTAGQEFMRETGRRRFDVYFPPEVTVAVGYYLSPLDGPYAGVVMDAKSVSADDAGRTTYWRVLALEVV